MPSMLDRGEPFHNMESDQGKRSAGITPTAHSRLDEVPREKDMDENFYFRSAIEMIFSQMPSAEDDESAQILCRSFTLVPTVLLQRHSTLHSR